MTRDDRIEQAASAHREVRGDGSVGDAPAWHDLDPAGREQVHRLALALRALEAAIDPEALSTTAHAVLARLR